jgi:hypothetical protein
MRIGCVAVLGSNTSSEDGPHGATSARSSKLLTTSPLTTSSKPRAEAVIASA